MLLKTATAVLVACAFLSSSAFAEVLHWELKIELERFDLETQFVDPRPAHREPLDHPKMDFYFINYTGLPSLHHNEFLEGFRRRIATFDGQPFNAIGFADIETATFSYSPVDFPLEADDTVILQTDTGAYYKVGNVVYSDVTGLVNFDYEDLIDVLAIGRVFQNSFENPVNANCGNEVVERERLEECDDGNTEDGDGCSSVCKHEERAGRCPCADNQDWNDVLANENFICGPSDDFWAGGHWFVSLNTSSGAHLLAVGDVPPPYCTVNLSDGSVSSLEINATELVICEIQILEKAAEHGIVCNSFLP